MRWFIIAVLALIYIVGLILDVVFDFRMGELLKGFAMAVAVILFITQS